jgi:surfeit locus 1 family protein
MARYRFTLRPWWILSHIFVVVVVVAFVNLGFWQLRRLDEKRDRNQVVTSRTAEPVAPVDDVLSVEDAYADADGVAFRRVTATGTYDPDQQVLVRGRSRDGAPGSWVLTPLVRDDGTAVVVNRGWIANSGQLDRVPDSVEVPSGEVSITGLLLPTEERAGYGPRDPADGTLANLARADIARMQQQMDERLVPAYVQLLEQQPEPGNGAPRLIPAPAVDEGPHLSYAVQWFFFASIGLIGYPIILRRVARDREEDEEARLEGGSGDDEGHDGDTAVAASSPVDGPSLDAVR